MVRRRLLGDDVWARHLEAPADEREVARYFTLGPDELAKVMNRRSDANRLGYALVLLYAVCPHDGKAAFDRRPNMLIKARLDVSFQWAQSAWIEPDNRPVMNANRTMQKGLARVSPRSLPFGPTRTPEPGPE